jgi:hypothetical protein
MKVVAKSGAETALHQLSQRTEIEVQILGGEAKEFADVPDGLFEPHQRNADGFNFFRGQRLLLHPPDRLTLHQLPQEFDNRQYQLRHRSLNIVGLGVPAQRRGVAAGAGHASARLP